MWPFERRPKSKPSTELHVTDVEVQAALGDAIITAMNAAEDPSTFVANPEVTIEKGEDSWWGTMATLVGAENDPVAALEGVGNYVKDKTGVAIRIFEELGFNALGNYSQELSRYFAQGSAMPPSNGRKHRTVYPPEAATEIYTRLAKPGQNPMGAFVPGTVGELMQGLGQGTGPLGN